MTTRDHAEWGARAPRLLLSLEPAAARRQLAVALAAKGWGGDVESAVLALNEALVNARQHAGGARRAEVRMNHLSLMIQVWDRGGGFDPTPYLEHPPDALAERGRGLWLMSRLADACEVHRDEEGTRLVLRFGLEPGTSRQEPAASRPA